MDTNSRRVRSDGRKGNSPWVVGVIGLAGLAMFGWLGVKLFLIGGHPYIRSDLEMVSGKIKHSGVLRSRYGDVLQIYLEGQDIAFRGSSFVYPKCYRKDLLNTLRPGAVVAIGVLPAEKARPYHSGIKRRPYLNIYAMIVNGQTALSVDDYNRCAAANDRVGRIVDPILLGISIALLTFSIVTIVRQRHTRLCDFAVTI